MTNRTMLFCALALSLAALSISMVPGTPAGHAVPQISVTPVSAMHSLTGVAFHSVAPGY
jgi:hypothetical protein